MKPIRILSPALELQGEVDNYLSLSFCRSYHSPGEFQLVTNRKVQNADQRIHDAVEKLGWEKDISVKTVGRIDVPVPLQETNLPIPEPTGQPLTPPTVQPASGEIPEGLEEYLPFLRYLYENRDGLYQLLTGTRDDGIIPRYAVPGEVRTKAIYMSHVIAKLAGEFSKEKKIALKEVMEGALIEYLQRYGFKREVETLLRNQ